MSQAPRRPEAPETPETPMFPVTIFLSPVEHGSLCTLPTLYRQVGRPMASLGDAVRAAIQDTVEVLGGHRGTVGAAA